MRNTRLILVFLIAYNAIHAQIPSAYYDDANGKEGYELKTALYEIIRQHTVLDYGELYTAYTTTDTKANNIVWDMYSDVPNGTAAYVYTHFSNNCGNYQNEGDCYNREHSFPQSWFNEASPMRTDLFHVVPSDGKVNGMRSSFPFGEVGTPTWTSTNGSKLGPSSFPGYSGTVFEPIDEYKGDFARSYFYMATRYENAIASWQNNGSADAVLDGSSTRVFDEWCLNMFLKWHSEDPVSEKEITRNDAVYAYQKNRNPFIDHPEYVSIIWDYVPNDTVEQDTTGNELNSETCSPFENIPASSSAYSSRSWTDINGLQWQATLARTDQEINGKCICLKGDQGAFLESSVIDREINIITFSAQQKFSGSGGGLLLYINDQFIERFEVGSQIQHFSSDNFSFPDNFTVRLASSGETRIAIDDICFGTITTTGLSKQTTQKARLYPNPFKDWITIQTDRPENIKHISLCDISGKTLKIDLEMGHLKALDTSSLKQGIYFVTLVWKDGTQQTTKIVRN